MRQVQEGVPLPPPKRVRQRPRSRYPFETLEVGEVFFVPHRPRNNLAPYVSTQGKRLGRKFRTRQVPARETLEGWEVCAPDDPRAVPCIGVWRVS